MAGPDPRDPGGITGVVASLRRAGLGDAVELVELPTSAMNSSLPAKLAQAAGATLKLIPRLLGEHRADVVHLHASTGGSLLRKVVLSWCCRASGVPYVAHEHSGELEEWIGDSRIRRAAARSLYRHAAAAIVLAERWRPIMNALGAEWIEVLPNGLSATERESLAAARGIRASDALSSATHRLPILLFYARWVAKKGPDRLADALRALDREDYEVRLYGSGDRQAMTTTFRGVGGTVVIGGWLDGDRKVEELGRAAALVSPSRAEGLPVALVEARAAGTPVIASDVGGVGEALRDYPVGLLLDPTDQGALVRAIRRLLDGEWPPDSGSAAFPRALQAEASVERLVEIYRLAATR